MADPTVTERRIRPIQDAIAAGNWKQALKDCEKWQKKGEISDRFLALKAAVLLSQPDQKTHEKGQAETLQLCRRTPPVLNIEAIYQLQDSLRRLSLDADEGPKLWEGAVAARPKDQELITTWLNDSISASNWRSAQKATMALRKAAPKERQYDFWNILMCYLIHEDQRLPEKDRKLFGTLANRMITKAAQAGPQDKAISNIEELNLLAAVLSKTGNVPDLIQLLRSEALKPVIDLDRAHADTILLEAFQQANDQSELCADFARSSIFEVADNSLAEDDRLWQLLVNSTRSDEQRREHVHRINSIIETQPRLRQAHLAKIELLAKSSSESSDCLEPLMNACMTYFQLFGAKAFCFDDLLSRLQQAGTEQVRVFKRTLTADASITEAGLQSLFVLKLEYYLLSEDEPSIGTILSFATKALRISINAHGDQAVGSDAALLAALMLLQLAARSRETSLVASAGLVLYTACSKFKDYYPLRVLLIQVQNFSGQIHLAMNNFFHLSVKNLQWETVGHLILSRISTMHPQQHGRGEESLNPLGALDTALSVFENSQRSLDKSVRDGLSHGSYSNVIDAIELRGRLQRSIVRQLYTIEERKCQRFRNSGVRPGFALHPGELVDLRDLSFMPTYSVEDRKLSDLLECGPRPTRGWIKAQSLHEHFLCYIMAELGAPDPKVILLMLANLSEAQRAIDVNASDLTKDERAAVKVHQALSIVAIQLAKKQSPNPRELEDVVDWIQATTDVKPAGANGVNYPNWRWLHHRFVRLETLQTIAHFAAIIGKKFKSSKEKFVEAEFRNSLSKLRPLVDEQVKVIHDEARALKEALNASGVLGQLVDVMLARQDGTEKTKELAEVLQEMTDEAAVEEYVGSLRESWEDAIDGVLAVKIKTI